MIRLARNAATAVLVALLALTQWGVKWSERVDPARIQPESGHAFIYPVESPRSDAEGGNRSTLELRENGRPLGPAHAMHDDIRQLGGGRFSHWGRLLYFSSSDGSDPRSNGRSYAIRHETNPNPLLGGVLLVALFALESRRLARGLDALARINPAWPALAIGLGALAFRIWVYARYHDDTIGHLVKGVPVSDGACWDAMAADFARGDRSSGLWETLFDALRPFGWIFMGAIYALTGPSVAVTQTVHIVLGALSAVLVFETLRRLAPLPVALLGAIYPAFSLVEARYGLTTATEPLGAFLSTLFLFLFVVAAAGLGRRRNALVWLAAGAVLGLVNLTRPELMPAIFAMPAALALVLTREKPRPGRRTLGVAGLLLVAGLALTMGPWLLRQRVKYGIWQVSANSAELLYAASSPRYRSWSPDVSALASGLDTRQRADFFSAGLRRNLREHPRFYLTNATDHAGRIAGRLLTRPPLLLALLVLVPAALGPAPDRRRLVRVLAPAAVLAAVLWLVPDQKLYWVWLLGLAGAVLWRAPIVIVGAFVASPIVALGLSAMSGDERLVYALEWPAFALALWLLAIALGGAPATARDRDLPGWGRAGWVARRLAVSALLILCLGLGKAVLAGQGTHAPRTPTILHGDEAALWIARALDAPEAAPYAPLRDRLEVRTILIRTDYIMRFRAGESVVHWNPLFKHARPYPFSILEPVQENYYVLPQGLDPPIGPRLVLVGLSIARPLYGTSFEVVALGTVAAGPGGPILHPDLAVARLHASELGITK